MKKHSYQKCDGRTTNVVTVWAVAAGAHWHPTRGACGFDHHLLLNVFTVPQANGAICGASHGRVAIKGVPLAMSEPCNVPLRVFQVS
jgi:hypothetical protein